MIELSTIQDIFRANIESGDQAGITFIEGENKEEYMSYKKLYMEARYMLYDLQQKNLQPGDELVFQFLSNKNFLITFWACIFGKIIPVPIVFGITIDTVNKVSKVWERLKNPYLITDLPTLKNTWKEHLKDKSEVSVDIDNRFLLYEDSTYSKQATPIPADSSDLVFIQFSSGSTGYPKGVENKQDSIIYNVNTTSYHLDIQASDKLLGWMPLTHDLGLVLFHLFPLLKNVPQFLMPPMVFYTYPNLWLKSLASHGITISGSPNFGFRHAIDNFKASELQGLSLNKLRALTNGAEPVSVAVCRDFEKMLLPYGAAKGVIIPGFGMAEAVLGVSFFSQKEGITRECMLNRHKLKVGDKVEFVEANSPDAVSFANLGLYTHTEIKITDKDMQSLPENSLGLIHLRSKAITSGFYNDPETTRKTISEDGWLNTGDLGFIHNQHLIITGRDKEMILINGQNYFPHDIDNLMEELPEIQFQQAVACNVFNEEKYQDDILVFMIYKGTTQGFIVLENLIKKHIGERTGLSVKKVIAVDKILKTTSGKIQRFLLVEEYLQGKYDSFIKKIESENEGIKLEFKKLSKRQIEEAILKLVRNLFDIQDFAVTSNFFDFGLTSIQLTHLKVNIESFLFDELDEVILFKYTNVKDLSEYLYKDILNLNTVNNTEQIDRSLSKNRMRRLIQPS